MGCSFISGIQSAVGSVVKAAAPVLPIVAGAFLGPAASALFDVSAGVGSAIAGAATGALTSASTGGNLLTGALSGAAGGYAGNGISNLFSSAANAASGASISGQQLIDAQNAYISAGYTPTEAANFVAQATGNSTAAIQAAIDTGGAVTGVGGGPMSYASNLAQNLLGTGSGNQALTTGLNAFGTYLNSTAAKDAASTAAAAQINAAQIAADAAKFRPVGVTTNFGSSNFGYDANGNLKTAGYSLNPQLQAQQNGLMAQGNPLLAQAIAAQGQTAPMATAANRMMSLGNSYLGSSPQEQAQKWYTDQQALLTNSDQSSYAALQNQLQQNGRAGLAIGGGNGFNAANPELGAYYNAMQQRNLGLAANATQAGQQYATYGAGLVGGGGDMLSSMYGVQNNAYSPYTTNLGTASTIEGLGQNALSQGLNIGAKGTASTAAAGLLQAQGINNAAQTMQPANALSPWGGLLTGAANSLQNYGQPQQQAYQFNPYTGASLL